MDNLLLQDAHALITGATAGIGWEIARLFVQHGASVTLIGRNQERAEKLTALLEKEKPLSSQKIVYFLCDVSSVSSVEEAFEKMTAPVDILVNNAGITRDNLLLRMREEEFDAVMNTNLKSVFATCKCAIRPMLKAKKGVIINISSVIGVMGNAGQTNYAASKAGIIGFTKSLAKEVAKKSIRVNAIAPGFIQTDMTKDLPENTREAIIKNIPMNQLGDPLDVAKVALFLASNLASYVTGQTIHVDGGMVM